VSRAPLHGGVSVDRKAAGYWTKGLLQDGEPYFRHAGTASDPYYRNNTLNVPLNTTFELTGEAAGLELFT
jgi:hypothetical protein